MTHNVLAAAGGTLADATEEAGVEANAQTLAAGAMGPVHLLQALADRLLLCCLEPLLPAASGKELELQTSHLSSLARQSRSNST